MGWKRLITIGSIVVLSLLGTANAQPPWAKFSYFKNWGGLNDSLSTTEIEDNEATDLQNVIFDTGGAIKKRFGYKTIPAPASRVASGTNIAITGLSFFQTNDSNRYVVAIANVDGTAKAVEKTYTIGGGLDNASWSDISFAGLPGSYSNDYLTSFSVAENKLVITIPSTTGVVPFKWEASGSVANLTADADCPTSSINVYHKNQLFLSGNLTFPSRVWFSALDDITAYDATDFFDVQTSDGTKVRGMVSAFNSLYIFKDRSIWRLSGTNKDDFVLEKTVDGIGTLSHQSIAVVNNTIVFTTDQGDIAAYDGGYNVVFLSQKIRNTINGLNTARSTNTLGLAFSTYKYADTDYYASMSNAGSGTNNKILLYDTFHKAWTKFLGINSNAWCVADDSQGKKIMVFGDYNGYVHYYPNTNNYYDGNVATSAISAFYQTKWFRYPELSLSNKYWRLLKTYVLSDNVGTFLSADCRSDYQPSGKLISINLGVSGALWDVAQWDVDTWNGTTLIIDREEIEKGEQMFQLKYSNDQVDEGFSILGFEIFIEPSDRI